MPLPQSPPTPVTWIELLALASSPGEVVRVALDFFASLTPQEVATLPPDCVPARRFCEPQDVVDYAFTLEQQRCHSDVPNTVLFRAANFYSHAARRAAELMSESPVTDAANASELGTTTP